MPDLSAVHAPRSWKSQPVAGGEVCPSFNDVRARLVDRLNDAGVTWSTSKVTRYARAITDRKAEESVYALISAAATDRGPFKSARANGHRDITAERAAFNEGAVR